MDVDLARYFNLLQESARTKTWEAVGEFRVDLLQGFADSKDWAGPEWFFGELIRTNYFSAELQELMKSKADASLKIGFALGCILPKAFNSFFSDRNLKALYCEYDCRIDLFPCFSYDRHSDFWASDFDAFIEGPSVEDFLEFDCSEMDAVADYLFRSYLHSLLFRVVGQLVGSNADFEFPFGFARHDEPITYLGHGQTDMDRR